MKLFLPFELVLSISFVARSGEAVSCHICDYTAAFTCEHESEYRLVDCSEFWTDSRYCLTFNGTRRSVTRDTDRITISTGLHRACQREADVEIYGLYDVEPGCRNLHVLNQNTSLYSNFFYDGTLCICEHDGCNGARTSRTGYEWSSAVITIAFAFSCL